MKTCTVVCNNNNERSVEERNAEQILPFRSSIRGETVMHSNSTSMYEYMIARVCILQWYFRILWFFCVWIGDSTHLLDSGSIWKCLVSARIHKINYILFIHRQSKMRRKKKWFEIDGITQQMIAIFYDVWVRLCFVADTKLFMCAAAAAACVTCSTCMHFMHVAAELPQRLTCI